MHVAHDMNDMGIFFRVHHLLDPHRTGRGHPAHVVAAQIDEHDVLGALLGIGKQIRDELFVLLIVPAARPRAGNGTHLQAAVFHAHEHFRRRADHRGVAQRQEIHVGRRVDEPQDPVQVKGIGLHAHGKALRQHHLENVAGLNVLAAALDRRLVLLLGEVREGLRRLLHGQVL